MRYFGGWSGGISGIRSRVVQGTELVKFGERLVLLLRNWSPGSLHEGLDFLQGKAAIFIGVHCLEDALVGRLKFQQGNGPVTVAVHDGKEHCRHASSQDPPSWLLGPSCPFLDPSPGPNQARSANPSSHHRLRYHLEQRGAEFGCSVAGAPAPIAAAGFVASALAGHSHR